MVRAVRANQWVISGETLDKKALDQAVYETFRNSARSIFDLYHYINDPSAIKRLIVFNTTFQQLIQRPEFDQRGLMVVGLHISNFDLALRAFTLQGKRPLILTIPDPQGSQRVEYEMRKKTGMNLVPASLSTLMQAIKYLQQGGVVMTGIDRPIPKPKCRPRFFGRPADLPMHHVYLAAKAHVPVMVMVDHPAAGWKKSRLHFGSNRDGIASGCGYGNTAQCRESPEHRQRTSSGKLPTSGQLPCRSGRRHWTGHPADCRPGEILIFQGEC